jgi:hypothetical protein
MWLVAIVLDNADLDRMPRYTYLYENRMFTNKVRHM